MKYYFFTILFIISSITAVAQEKFTISGTVSDKDSGETLIGINVLVPSQNAGTVTNVYGFYSMTLPAGSHKIQYSSIGYTSEILTIDLQASITKNISLSENLESLTEVIITTDSEKLNIRDPQMSANTLKSSSIKKIPVVLGEADVIQAITLLPGVTNAGEGASGFNVRGGGAGQNLVLLDEATLFNSSHLFGFFSVFNPDAIKDLTLYKGGIPARFGGRIASVLDIYQKDGNSKELKITGGLGLVASRLLIEGPIVKDKVSFLVGGRSSYAHLFLPLFDNDNIAKFFDLNAKVSYKIDDKNKLFLSGYSGRDKFEISDSFENIFGNSTVNLRWNHLFSDKLFSNLSAIYSDYFYNLQLKFVEFQFDSGIQNLNLKYDFTHYISEKTKLQYGLNSIYYSFNPGDIEPTTASSGINPFSLTKKFGFENAFYIDGELEINDRLNIQAGLRLSTFNRLGQDSLNIYADNNPILYDENLDIYQDAEPIGTESFDRTETIKAFANLEPRLAISYLLADDAAIKASYNRTAQYIHLISNTTSPTPFDIYAPSGRFIDPQIGDQVALGYFKTFKDFTFEVESYYKKTQNRLDYVDGADLIANDAVEQILLSGEARSYGIEFLARKTQGRLTGWFSYTLSKSEQRTPGRSPQEIGINNGEWYNSAWDKTHDISVTAQYQFSKKWSFGANFIIQSGLPFTFPEGQYIFEGQVIPVFEARNASRLSSFHRMDISATYIPKKSRQFDSSRKKAWRSEWVFSAYNIYNRRNAASISFRENTSTGQNEAIRLSIFGIIPAITYNFKF